MDVLNYKDFIGSITYCSHDEVFYGKIEGINDLVTFEGKSVENLKQSFEEAVEDYLRTYKKLNKN